MTWSQTYPEHLLHLLHAHQQEHRYISDAAILEIAERLQLPRAQVEAVVEFYAFFSRTPRGKFDLRFSTCSSCGDARLMQQLCDLLHVSWHETRADGRVSISPTSCIGMCDHGASLLIHDRPLVALDAQRIEQIASFIETDTPLEQWPKTWFTVTSQNYRQDILLSSDVGSGDALRAMEAMGAEVALSAIREADLRGRGGAGFRTAMKWQFCREATGDAHYVICNADEGEPGTFKDRQLLTEHADALLEGMALCGRVIAAKQGLIYLRGEYRYLLPHLEARLAARRQSGLLGEAILGVDGFDFEISIVVGAGAYICGEESALIESLEQKCGHPRIRPPFPVTHGYLGQPTVVNNVETLIAAAYIVQHGAQSFLDRGTASSSGTKLLSISGDCARSGIYEYPFGVTLAEVLEACGARDVQAVQVGGPSGVLLAADAFQRTIAFDDVATGGSLMIFDTSRDLLQVIQSFAHFFAHESCGFCTPCRVGTVLLQKGMDKICGGHGTAHDMAELSSMVTLVSERSHCGLGMTAANPIRDGMAHFPLLFNQRLSHQEMEPDFDLDGSLAEARKITGRDDAEAHL